MNTTPFIQQQITSGKWRAETVPASLTGLARDIEVYRATRKGNLIVAKWHGDAETFCPPIWSDLAIGSGPCSLGCRACFLILTFREMRDPRRHVLYDNDNFSNAARQWLTDPLMRVPPERAKSLKRQPAALNAASKVCSSLGVGIDRSDSLLYEDATGHVRAIAPLFADARLNPLGHKLVLLTKTDNVPMLALVRPEHRQNVIMAFSLNPEPVANLWEGLWDDGTRITPSIERRLRAARLAQDLGYEVRARIDPILTPDGWQVHYTQFLEMVRQAGVNFSLWTLGTYREKNDQLAAWAKRWGLAPMEWQPAPGDLVRDGTHWHLRPEKRIDIYAWVADEIRAAFPDAQVGLCKETHAVRRVLTQERGLSKLCNCLPQ